MSKTTLFLSLIVSLFFTSSVFADSITKKGASEEQQMYVDYAYDISGGNEKFVYLLESENGKWSIDRKSGIGYWGYNRIKGKYMKNYDYGFCQVSEQYHGKIVYDKRFFTDWKWQLDQCWKLYSGGTRFYGKWHTVKDHFIIEDDDEE